MFRVVFILYLTSISFYACLSPLVCVLKAVFILRLRSVFTSLLIVSSSCQLSGCVQFSFSACLLIGNDFYFKLLPRIMATAVYPRLPAVKICLANSYDLWLVKEGETNAEIQAGELIGFNIGSFNRRSPWVPRPVHVSNTHQQ